MAQKLKSKCMAGIRGTGAAALFVAAAVFVCSGAHGAPLQFIDSYTIQKSANSTYTYQSSGGLERAFNFVFGDSFASGYKSQNLPHYMSQPVIIHAPDNRSFVKFGLRRPDDELVFLESKHSSLNKEKKQEIVFETTAPDHKFSHVELFTNDPNFLLSTEFKDNALLAKFTYTGKDQTGQKHATINVYGYHNDRMPKDCFLYYEDCQHQHQQGKTGQP